MNDHFVRKGYIESKKMGITSYEIHDDTFDVTVFNGTFYFLYIYGTISITWGLIIYVRIKYLVDVKIPGGIIVLRYKVLYG